jgi:signal transduction histidine kinase
MKAAQGYWKQFVELGTGFVRRYRSDIFLQTEIHIIALQVAYASVILVLTIGAILILYKEIVGGVVAAIAVALTATTTPMTGTSILAQLEAARTREIASVSLLIFAATAIFGYLVARLALAPARNALTSQKQFIGNIAHELRTPLAILKTNTEVLLLEGGVSQSVDTTLKSNVEELDRISDTINNLLSLNALVHPEQTSFTSVEVATVVERSLEKLAPVLEKKPFKIEVDLPSPCVVWGNATAIEQIVTNILKNALQHTTSGGITVSANPAFRHTLELMVRDTGSGIKQQDIFRIFEPFYRGDRARTRTGGAGSGLGLTIVNELVKMNHGHINIRSTPGKGTTVRVTLPTPKPTKE